MQESSPADVKQGKHLLNPAHSTACNWSTAGTVAGTASENAYIHSVLHSHPFS